MGEIHSNEAELEVLELVLINKPTSKSNPIIMVLLEESWVQSFIHLNYV